MNAPLRALLRALAPALVPALLAAQTVNGGPYGPITLLLPSGPRTLALGNTGVAGRDDDVIFFNPAQLVIARGFSGSIERYSSTSAGGELSAVTRLNTGGIAIGMKMADYETPLGTYPLNRGSMLDPAAGNGTTLEATVGVGQVIKGVRVGLAGKYVEDNVPAIRVSRGAVDVGVSKDFFGPYTFALAVQNIGASTDVLCGETRTCTTAPGIADP